MTRSLLTGNGAAAWGARLAEVDYVPAFPITPQTEIIETISGWIEKGLMDARFTTLESEHSMITAAGSAAATGIRVFTATSSQGLVYGMEMLYTVAGWRAPFVMVNVSRGLSSPITLEPDHNDVLAARDSGFLQIHCATCQEVLDSVIFAFRLAEDENVRLPVIINQDGFYLSFTREPVEVPDLTQVRKFLPEFNPGNGRFRASAPCSLGGTALGGTLYSYFKYQMHLASLNALKVFDTVEEEFADIFGRKYGVLEAYRMDDAELCFFMTGSFSVKAKNAVNRLRSIGLKIGLLRLRLMRPFPAAKLRQALCRIKGVAVIDQNISIGKGGILYTELGSVLAPHPTDTPVILNYIGGLGGRDITQEEFFEMAKETGQAVKTGISPEPRLLFTETELKQVRNMQTISHDDPEQIRNGVIQPSK